jgi:magnesium chelatase subunit D
LLLLLLDYTSLRGCEWESALLPHLSWAYAARARVGLIQVGAAGAADLLRAERILAPSLLVPRLVKAFEDGPGRATPLAHGLELALQTLTQARQNKRSPMRRTEFVLLTDGRGNVPLRASRTARRPARPVAREGIDDAMEVARAFAGLKDVFITLLNPGPAYLQELPLRLAGALGAAVTAVAPRQGVGE